MKEITELALRKALYQQARREASGNLDILVRMGIFFPAFITVLIVPIFVPPIDFVRQFHNWMYERPIDTQPLILGALFVIAILALMSYLMWLFDQRVERRIDKRYGEILDEHGIQRRG